MTGHGQSVLHRLPDGELAIETPVRVLTRRLYGPAGSFVVSALFGLLELLVLAQLVLAAVAAGASGDWAFLTFVIGVGLTFVCGLALLAAIVRVGTARFCFGPGGVALMWQLGSRRLVTVSRWKWSGIKEIGLSGAPGTLWMALRSGGRFVAVGLTPDEARAALAAIAAVRQPSA